MKNSIKSITYQSGTYLIPIIMTPILVMGLGANNYGLYGVLTAYIVIAQMIIEWGFIVWGQKMISKNNTLIHRSNVFNTIKKAKIILLYTTILITPILGFIFPHILNNLITLIISLLIAMLAAVYNTNYIYIYQYKLSQYIKYMLLGRIIVIPIIYMGLQFGGGLEFALILNQLGVLGGSIIAYIALINSGQLKKTQNNISNIKETLTNSFNTVPGNLFGTMYTSCIPLALSLNLNLETLGAFIGAFAITKAVQGISSPLQQQLLPILLNSKWKSAADIKKNVAISYALQILYGLFWVLISILFSEIISEYLFRNKIEGISNLIIIMSPIVLFGGIASMATNQLLSLPGGESDYSKVMIFGTTTGLLITYILSKRFGIYGSIYGIISIEIIIICILFFYIKRYNRS